MKVSGWMMATAVLLSLMVPQFGVASQQAVCSCSCEKGNCNLDDFKSDQVIKKSIEIATDPTGLAVSALDSEHGIEDVLKNYVKKHNCSLYYMSMQELTQGLLKGFKLDDNLAQSQRSPQQESSRVSKKQKYILISPDKYDCIKKLGFKLPVRAMTPNAKE